MPDEMVSVTLDGQVVQVPKGTPIIEALDQIGVHIPRFCYHSRMKAVGVCRMCLVEVSGPRGFSIQPSCYLAVAEGMEVVTTSEKVKKAQSGVIEFLLANHPLDCPVCDKGGECPLQDQAFAHGAGETRYVEEKRHYAKPIPISRLINLDRERCIQCDRCTRFADEVAGEALIDFRGRGNAIRISTFSSVEFDSYFSGNVTQICPVGALTATPYRFKARPWDLTQAASTCGWCSMGCQVSVQASQNELTRMLGIDSDAVNHSWLCDRGRFGIAEVNNRDARVLVPTAKANGIRGEVSWASAAATVARLVKQARASGGNASVAVIGSGRLNLEDSYAWAKLALDVVGTPLVDGVLGQGEVASTWFERAASIDQALAARALIALNVEPKEEVPVLHLRLREAVGNGLHLIEVNSTATSLSPMAATSIQLSPEGVGGLAEAVAASLPDGDGDVVILVGGRNRAMDPAITGGILRDLVATVPGARILSALGASNVHGAFLAGLAPGVLPGAARGAVPSTWRSPADSGRANYAGILRAAAAGEVGVLLLLDCDLEEVGLTPEAIEALGERCALVSLASYESATTRAAAVTLPLATWGEARGSVVNGEGRMLRLGEQLEPAGLSKPGWVAASLIAGDLGDDMSILTAGDIWAELKAWGGAFAGVEPSIFSSTLDGPLLPVARWEAGGAPRALDPVATPGISSVSRQGPDFRAGAVLDPHAVGTGAAPSAKVLASGREVPAAVASERVPMELGVPGEDEAWLILSRRVYEADARLAANPALASFVRGDRVRVSPARLARLGASDGDRVQVVGPVVLQAVAHADDAIPDWAVAVEGRTIAVTHLIDGAGWSRVRLERLDG